MSSRPRHVVQKQVKPKKTFDQLLVEEGYKKDKYGKSLNYYNASNIDSEGEHFDEDSFAKLEEDLQKQVAKIMAKLKKSRRKRKTAKRKVHNKIGEIKSLHEESNIFKNNALDQIDEASNEFRVYKQNVSASLMVV